MTTFSTIETKTMAVFAHRHALGSKTITYIHHTCTFSFFLKNIVQVQTHVHVVYMDITDIIQHGYKIQIHPPPTPPPLPPCYHNRPSAALIGTMLITFGLVNTRTYKQLQYKCQHVTGSLENFIACTEKCVHFTMHVAIQ